ncbi:MAG: hypothetical protein DMG53_04440 [Acidobacteria bacterium]|nr:MAG: hypothetical protein DMG53_04440 [Acidobacteriota bacterium]
MHLAQPILLASDGWPRCTAGVPHPSVLIELTTNTRTTRTGFCFLRACAVAASVASVAGSTLAQQEQSETQWEREHGIQHEKRLLDNKFVAVERITFPPNNEGFGYARESEPARIVFLRFRAAEQDATALGGWRFEKVSFFSREAGRMIVPPGAGAFRLVNIYLSDQPERAPVADDAVKLDPKHNEVLLENSRIRVVRIHFAPGESGPMVDKRPRVIIVLTDSHATVTLPDGHSEVRDAKAGTVYFGNAGRQATNNIGTTPLENVVVELKTK